MIQFFSVTMLYAIGSNLSDNQFLYIDIMVLMQLFNNVERSTYFG